MGIISYVNEEIQVIRERDPAIKSNMEVFLYSSFKAILHYRIAHKLYLKKHYFLARWVSQRAARKTGIEIHPTRQMMGLSPFFVSVRTARNSSTRSFTFSRP